jgi:hypothetical protein
MVANEIIGYCKRFVSGSAEERSAAREWLLTCAPFLAVADEFRKTGFSFVQIAEFIACDAPEPLGRLAILRVRSLLAESGDANDSLGASRGTAHDEGG